MIIRTRSFFAPIFLALHSLVKRGMILLLLPPMTHVAVYSVLTTLHVIVYHVFGFPVEAGDRAVIRKNAWFSSVIL